MVLIVSLCAECFNDLCFNNQFYYVIGYGGRMGQLGHKLNSAQ